MFSLAHLLCYQKMVKLSLRTYIIRSDRCPTSSGETPTQSRYGLLKLNITWRWALSSTTIIFKVLISCSPRKCRCIRASWYWWDISWPNSSSETIDRKPWEHCSRRKQNICTSSQWILYLDDGYLPPAPVSYDVSSSSKYRLGSWKRATTPPHQPYHSRDYYHQPSRNNNQSPSPIWFPHRHIISFPLALIWPCWWR